MTTRNKAQDEPIPVDALDNGEEIVLDFSTVTDQEALPEGPYLCMVQSFKSGKSRQGNGTMTIEYVISDPEDYSTRKIFDTMSLQPQALFNLYGCLTALGEDPEALKSGKFKIEPDNYVGRSCVVTIRHDEYQGRTTSRVRRVQPAESWEESTSF